MTDEQINRAIAEICGWTEIQFCTCCDNVRRGKPPGKSFLKHLEDYCNDLNAMHHLEKMLTESQRDIVYPRQLGSWKNPVSIIYATARQRAEAFLRVLGKWEEVQG